MRPDKKKKRDFKGAGSHGAGAAPAPVRGQEAAVPADPVGGSTPEQDKAGAEQSKSESDVERTRYAKRNISSNWTKYEIPTSDEDDDAAEGVALTGEDFRSALQRAGKSNTLFLLKAEKEWEEKQSSFTNQLFSLDLKRLEASVSSVPLYHQIDLDEDELAEGVKELLDARAAAAMANLASAKAASDDAQRFVQLLKKRGDEGSRKEDCRSEPGHDLQEGSRTRGQVARSENEVDKLEAWLDDFWTLRTKLYFIV